MPKRAGLRVELLLPGGRVTSWFPVRLSFLAVLGLTETQLVVHFVYELRKWDEFYRKFGAWISFFVSSCGVTQNMRRTRKNALGAVLMGTLAR